LDPEELASQSVRIKEEQLRREEEKVLYHFTLVGQDMHLITLLAARS